MRPIYDIDEINQILDDYPIVVAQVKKFKLLTKILNAFFEALTDDLIESENRRRDAYWNDYFWKYHSGILEYYKSQK